MKIDRVYRPYWEWEEIGAGMYGDVANKKAALNKAIKFTGNHQLYGRFMLRVVREWPNSCENALTDYSLNRKAWVGHAAVALAHGIPEHITREAWGHLTDEQQLLANREAERAIQQWEHDYRKSRGLHNGMEAQVLL